MACGFVTLGMPLMTHQSNEDEASIAPFRGEWWKEAGYSFQPTFGREAPVANPFQSESRDVGFSNRSHLLDPSLLSKFIPLPWVQGKVAGLQTFFP